MNITEILLFILIIVFIGAGILFGLIPSKDQNKVKKTTSVKQSPQAQGAAILTDEEREEMLKSMKAYAKDHPENVAKQVRSMMQK
jgi:flagellar biosynthesis/type III secretory pathway M-ring protein FliF/YscJ